MTASELQGLLTVLDEAVHDLECITDDCDAEAACLNVAAALKPQRDAVREAWLRAVRVEAMAAE